jgi:hypothetical protein
MENKTHVSQDSGPIEFICTQISTQHQRKRGVFPGCGYDILNICNGSCARQYCGAEPSKGPINRFEIEENPQQRIY